MRALFLELYNLIGVWYVIEKVKMEVTPYLGFTISGKLNFNYCALGNFGPLEIGGVIRDHSGFVVRGFSKIVGEGLVIETKILALLEGLLWARAHYPLTKGRRGFFYFHILGV